MYKIDELIEKYKKEINEMEYVMDLMNIHDKFIFDNLKDGMFRAFHKSEKYDLTYIKIEEYKRIFKNLIELKERKIILD